MIKKNQKIIKTLTKEIINYSEESLHQDLLIHILNNYSQLTSMDCNDKIIKGFNKSIQILDLRFKNELEGLKREFKKIKNELDDKNNLESSSPTF